MCLPSELPSSSPPTDSPRKESVRKSGRLKIGTRGAEGGGARPSRELEIGGPGGFLLALTKMTWNLTRVLCRPGATT